VSCGARGACARRARRRSNRTTGFGSGTVMPPVVTPRGSWSPSPLDLGRVRSAGSSRGWRATTRSRWLLEALEGQWTRGNRARGGREGRCVPGTDGRRAAGSRRSAGPCGHLVRRRGPCHRERGHAPAPRPRRDVDPRPTRPRPPPLRERDRARAGIGVDAGTLVETAGGRPRLRPAPPLRLRSPRPARRRCEWRRSQRRPR
jgi:hypothetical protein